MPLHSKNLFFGIIHCTFVYGTLYAEQVLRYVGMLTVLYPKEVELGDVSTVLYPKEVELGDVSRDGLNKKVHN